MIGAIANRLVDASQRRVCQYRDSAKIMYSIHEFVHPREPHASRNAVSKDVNAATF